MKIFWGLFFALLFLHQDFWNWSSEEVILLGMPMGLLYHAFFSIACSVLGVWAVVKTWPKEWEEYAEQKGGKGAG
jgi:hypothetical protein